MKIFAASMLALGASVLPVSAAQWQSEEVKGIFSHTVQDGTARLEVVCDPEGLWTPPEFHVVATENGRFMEGDTVEVRTDAKTMTYSLSGGSILGETAEEWNELIAAIGKPGTITFSATGKEVTFNIEGSLPADCVR
ncbi:hypothetical protein [Paracoccus beibuensis]|uniref:hypothetical protein n=1 Tax=Paracoccus beibuensis TaxID=547602 RepID=UPI00224061BC|nr:hypothetical protein [Paracoccus beibuensis]